MSDHPVENTFSWVLIRSRKAGEDQSALSQENKGGQEQGDIKKSRKVQGDRRKWHVL